MRSTVLTMPSTFGRKTSVTIATLVLRDGMTIAIPR
jgi:hypothetical protein